MLHRFYYRCSLLDFKVEALATASVYLASKVEESPRKYKDVLTVVDYAIKVLELEHSGTPFMRDQIKLLD